jgi:hypothetical protein
MRTHGVSAAGQKKGIFGRVRAKAGQRPPLADLLQTFRSRILFGINAADASRTDQCYEPTNADVAVAIPELDAKPGDFDHDFVIDSLPT